MVRGRGGATRELRADSRGRGCGAAAAGEGGIQNERIIAWRYDSPHLDSLRPRDIVRSRSYFAGNYIYNTSMASITHRVIVISALGGSQVTCYKSPARRGGGRQLRLVSSRTGIGCKRGSGLRTAQHDPLRILDKPIAVRLKGGAAGGGRAIVVSAPRFAPQGGLWGLNLYGSR